jgi:hypothetical protein
VTVIPLPAPEDTLLTRPSRDEVLVLAGAFATAAAPPDGLTAVQRAVLNALVESMTSVAVDVATLPPVSPLELGETLRRRDAAFRSRMVQTMLLAELVLNPLPAEVTARVEEYARTLGVDDDMLRVARRLSDRTLGLALVDFERSGYFEQLQATDVAHLHTSASLEDAWQTAVADDALFDRWSSLEECPPGSLGRGVWEFYRARGFTFPGRPDSAPPNLAQHDWIHVLADYGSTVQSEIEVFGLIARANDDPHAFSLLAMVLGLFETGYLYGAARGFFAYDVGHFSRDAERMAIRLADAMYRGAILATHLNDTGRGDRTDLMATDWFAHADRELDELRTDLGLVPRSARAIAAGSVTPWEPGGISTYQYAHGIEVAAAHGCDYESFGAEPG